MDFDGCAGLLNASKGAVFVVHLCTSEVQYAGGCGIGVSASMKILLFSVCVCVDLGEKKKKEATYLAL